MKKTTIPFLLIISLTILLSSCIILDGKWNDSIKLSVKTAEFSANGDSIVITTKGSLWKVSSVSVDDRHFFGLNGINIESNKYTIKQDCFVVEKRDQHTLFIKLEANYLNVSRKVIVGLEVGDYFDAVTITQKPK